MHLPPFEQQSITGPEGTHCPSTHLSWVALQLSGEQLPGHWELVWHSSSVALMDTALEGPAHELAEIIEQHAARMAK